MIAFILFAFCVALFVLASAGARSIGVLKTALVLAGVAAGAFTIINIVIQILN